MPRSSRPRQPHKSQSGPRGRMLGGNRQRRHRKRGCGNPRYHHAPPQPAVVEIRLLSGCGPSLSRAERPSPCRPSSLQPHPPRPVEVPPPARLSPASSAAAWWQRRLISMVTRFRIQRWPSPQPGPAGPLPSSAGSRASCASDSPAGAPHMIKPGETSAFQSPYQPGWGTTSVELTGTAQARSNLGARPMRAVLRCPDGSSSVERRDVLAVRQAGRQYRWLRFTGLNAFPQDAQ